MFPSGILVWRIGPGQDLGADHTPSVGQIVEHRVGEVLARVLGRRLAQEPEPGAEEDKAGCLSVQTQRA